MNKKENKREGQNEKIEINTREFVVTNIRLRFDPNSLVLYA